MKGKWSFTVALGAGVAVCLGALAVRAAEPLVQTPARTLSQAVADGTADIRVTTSGTLTAPLLLRPGQKLTCEPGVIITCKWGVNGNCLEAADDCVIDGCTVVCQWTGAADAPVAHREGMHGIGVYGAKNVVIRNAHVSGCYGDGIYVGPKTPTDRTPAQVAISNTVLTANYRQGLSVVSGVGTIEACTLSLTKGKSPQAGIDVEPDHPKDVIDLKVINCLSDANTGNPYLVNLYKLGADANPPKVVFSGCKAVLSPKQWTDLRLAGINDSPSGLPRATLPKGTLIEWDGLKLVKVP